MKVLNGSSVVSGIKKYAQRKMSEIAKYDYGWISDSYYAYQSISESDNMDDMLAFMEGDDIVDLAYVSTLFGIPTIRPYFDCERHNEVIELIREMHHGEVLLYGDYSILSSQNLFQSNLRSRYNDKTTYNLNSSMLPLWVFSEDKTDMVRDAIEKKYFAVDVDANQITYQVMTANEVYDYLYDKNNMCFLTWGEPCGFAHVAGFTYMETAMNNPTHRYLVAICDGIIVGCIKYGFYYDDHYGLNYIDVAVPYRRKGIATSLIRELSLRIENDHPLFLSNESDMGKMCRIHEHFARYTWPCGVYAEGVDYKYQKIA